MGNSLLCETVVGCAGQHETTVVDAQTGTIYGQTSVMSTPGGVVGMYPLRGLTPFRRGSRLRQGKHGVSALLRMIVPRFADKSTLFGSDVVKVTRFVKSLRKRTTEHVIGVTDRTPPGQYALPEPRRLSLGW
ncbi:hypothetical protein GCM10022294_32890 [Dietzia aurantiaca]